MLSKEIMIEDKVKELLSMQFGVEQNSIKSNTRLSQDLNADSLDIVETVLTIENEFDIELEKNEYEHCDSVAEIATLIQKKLEKS